MPTLPPGRRAFTTPMEMLVWAVDEGVLDDTWVEGTATPPDAGVVVRLRHRLLRDPPAASPKGDHSWWTERTSDDVLPIRIRCIDVSATEQAHLTGPVQGYDVWRGEGGTGFQLLLPGGWLRIAAGSYQVDVLAVAWGAPRID